MFVICDDEGMYNCAYWRTSWYTMLGVCFPSAVTALVPWNDVARENATYSWPWLKTPFCKYTPVHSRDWPWALLIVKQYASLTGNCFRARWNGTHVSCGASVIFGIMTSCPLFCVAIISATIIWESSWRMISLVPLQRPFFGLRLRSRIIVAPTCLEIGGKIFTKNAYH